MSVYRMEDYKIKIRNGSARPTGAYEITRRGNRRPVTQYSETYKTNAGEFTPEKWKWIVRECIEASGSKDLLKRIIDYCRTHCVWLKTEKDREEYAMEILIGRTYQCWMDFPVDNLLEGSAFVFEFP